jgi:hypothetical protein
MFINCTLRAFHDSGSRRLGLPPRRTHNEASPGTSQNIGGSIHNLDLHLL